MDELQSYQRERPRPSEEKREKKRSGRRDYLVRVIAVQLAVCAVLLTGAFLMVKTNPNAQKALREAYEGILSQDWSAQEAAAASCAFFFARYSRAFMRSYSRRFSRLRARYSLEYCRW